MAPRRTLTALVAALALAAPSAALAQSAGDEQYADPFGGSNGSNSGSNGSNGGSNGSPGTTGTPGTTAPATPAPAATTTGTGTTGTTTTTTTATAAASSGRQLPFTGAPVGLVGLAGVLMLGGGVALRVRLRERDD